VLRLASVLVLAVLLLAAASAHAISRADPRGDAGSAADIVALSVARTGADLEFGVTLATGDPLPPDAELFLPVDTHPATGDQHGVDLVYSLRGAAPGLRARRWNGVQHAAFDSRASAGLEDGVATFTVPVAELGSPASIRFGAISGRGADSDVAPDGGTWTFRLRASVRSASARFQPAVPVAGREFRVAGAHAVLSDRSRRSGTATCVAKLGGAPLAGRGCRWQVPRSARGQGLLVAVRVRVAGVGAAVRTYRFRVR
jgi:hypothetical protein